MKEWCVSKKDEIIETFIVLASIFLLILGLYISSKWLFPDWNDTEHGNIVLLSTIMVGTLTNLKNIIDLIEKWFFKKDKYNLSDEQKKVLIWLVNQVEAEKLNSEFSFVYTNSERVSFRECDNLNQSEIIDITKGSMIALNMSGLIYTEPTMQANKYFCVIQTKQAKKAINSNFKK